jgi:hypothetical protein
VADDKAIIRTADWQARARWVTQGYQALQATLAKNAVPVEAQEAFSDLADSMGMNALVPRLVARLDSGAAPEAADADDLWRAEFRMPVLLRAADSLLGKVNYGTREQERKALTELATAAADDMVSEAKLSFRVGPWTFAAITVTLSLISWLLIYTFSQKSREKQAAFDMGV